jgi:RNA polymerase sigma factor (sigma-70 family)
MALMQAADRATDADLLQSFLDRRDEAAFEGLLRRHGPMVLGVCRRVLGNMHDAEDAFQASFFVLARKANTVRPREMVGPWLYGVALRTALKARAMNAKRRLKERRAGELPVPGDGPPEELLARLDEELGRLPERYRLPVVLCELSGRSRSEVASQLHIPEGTLSSRLARAKKLLARRLSRYGAALSVGSLAALLSRDTASGCVPASLLHSTARIAVLTAGAVSARVVELTEGVMRAMLLSKLKLVWAVCLAVVVGVGAVGLTYRQVAAQTGPSNAAPRAARATADELEELRLEVAALRKGLEAMRARVKALEERGATSAATTPASDGSGQTRPLLPPRPAGAQRTQDPTPAGDGSGQTRPLLPPRPAGAQRTQDPTGKPGAQPFREAQRTLTERKALSRDALAQAEAALKKLRANPNDEQAADALERALKQMKERVKPKAPDPTQGH